jgi:uncharacterized protein YbjT (DUF2867 family)
MKTVLVSAANGETGRPLVNILLKKGFQVRAFVRADDARAQSFRERGVDVVVGDLLNLADVRRAMAGVQMAYFCYAMGEGLVEAAVMFAQAAKEENVELIVNMSHKQSRPKARSWATQSHWLSEQVFEWSGVPAVHLRVTFFMQWILYIAKQIQYGRYVMPFDKDSRFAPIAGSDIALIIANIFASPAGHAGQAYPIHGPVEYSHEELAAEVGRVLGRELPFEQVTVSTFLELLGIPGDTVRRHHFEAVTIDQQEGRLAGTDSIGTRIMGQPLMTVEAFVNEHRAMFDLPYKTP